MENEAQIVFFAVRKVMNDYTHTGCIWSERRKQINNNIFVITQYFKHFSILILCTILWTQKTNSLKNI